MTKATAHTLECQRQYAASADSLWQIVGDFYSDWHPLIEQCSQEDSAPIRRFTMPGSSQIYREQLTYYSDTQRCFRYEMLEGIAGVERYCAGVVVEANADGCLLRWWADITGAEDLVAKVAKGTKGVFEAGFDVLTSSSSLPSPVGEGLGMGGRYRHNTQSRSFTEQSSPPSPALAPTEGGRETRRVSVTPKLTCTHHSSLNNSDWLCLFLHGIGGNRTNWDDQLASVAQVMPCAALDLRGYGDSVLGAQQTTVDDYCADIRAVASHFGAKHLVLAGLSYGSWIATHFAVNYADKLAGLVLCGGCTGMSEAAETVRGNFLATRLAPMDAGQTPADFADNVVAMIAGPQATAEHKQAMHASMAAIPAATYRDALHCFTHPPGRFDFGRLACPALLMTGEFDRLAPPEEIGGVAERMVEAERLDSAPLPDVRFELIPAAGHIANLEQPATYNQLLTDFLHKLTAAALASEPEQTH